MKAFPLRYWILYCPGVLIGLGLVLVRGVEVRLPESDGEAGPSDAWKQYYFHQLGVDPNADADGDGQDNGSEYYAGTNPLDPCSVLRIESIRYRDGRLEISFPYQDRRAYPVDRSHDLKNWSGARILSWEVVEDQATVHLPLEENQSQFFRVRASPLSPPTVPPEFSSEVYPTYAEWREACLRLPFNREVAAESLPHELLPLPSYAAFEEVLEAALRYFVDGPMARRQAWVGGMPGQDTFFNTQASYFSESPVPFQPFAGKLEVPAGARALFHGDFHGDIHSLLAMLDWLQEREWIDGFHITNPDLYLVFLGDYTDRGNYGLEVVYSLLRLKLANPLRTFLVRGNHEDYQLNLGYGFSSEINAKYGNNFNLARYWRLYDFLPVVLYFGVNGNFLQCCHGGMEPGFLPRDLLQAPCRQNFQLLGPLDRAAFHQAHPELTDNLDPQSGSIAAASLTDFTPASPAFPSPIGFLWNDFYLLSEEPGLGYLPGRGFLYGQSATRIVLQAAASPTTHIHAVFRAHQHRSYMAPVMRRLLASNGIYQHWQPQDRPDLLEADITRLQSILTTSPTRPIPEGSVWTFNVAPDSTYGANLDFSFDSFALLTTASQFGQWSLQVINQTILSPNGS